MNLQKLSPLSMERTINFATDTSWGISDPDRFHALLDEARKLVSPGFTWATIYSLGVAITLCSRTRPLTKFGVVMY